MYNDRLHGSAVIRRKGHLEPKCFCTCNKGSVFLRWTMLGMVTEIRNIRRHRHCTRTRRQRYLEVCAHNLLYLYIFIIIDNIFIYVEYVFFGRLQSRRQIANPVSEFMLRSWKNSVSEETGREVRAPLPINKQIPTRITKKDVFMSRGWGAGGMPFSVLYMNPRSNHVVTATSSKH